MQCDAVLQCARQIQRRTGQMFEQTPRDTRRSTHDVLKGIVEKLVTFIFDKVLVTCDAQHQYKLGGIGKKL